MPKPCSLSTLLASLFFLLLIFSGAELLARDFFGCAANIIGRWRFVGHVYHGESIPPLNSKLVLTFEFNADGTDVLKWYRQDEAGFCERTAQYVYDGERILWQKVIATNPENASDCGRDPDMMIGKETETLLYPNGDKLYMDLPLGDEVLVYIWERF